MTTSARWLAVLVLIHLFLGRSTGLQATGLGDNSGERANAGTVTIVSGGVEGTYIRIAADLSAVLDDGEDLRVLPVLGKGSVQNIHDVLYLRGVDIGIVQSDVLAFLREQRGFANLPGRIRYITKLYNEELHLLARSEITDIRDLANKKVNFDGRGSGTFMTASLLFQGLRIPVQPTTYDQALALERLRAGEIAALAYVAGKPTRLFANLKADDGVHFLPIPLDPALLEVYLPSRLTAADYPGLIIQDDVETIAVGAVMAVFNWESGKDRHRKVTRFVETFFSRFDEFLKPPRHAKWKEVNLTAEVPGWTRFEPAELWLRQARIAGAAGDPAAMRSAFRSFVLQRGATAEQADQLFRQFLTWHEQARR